uniref:Uncharacterized protein n=1 Tax=Anguilla anguilla TaxID=7936 RepID=A0A0E9RDV6_ANGAN
MTVVRDCKHFHFLFNNIFFFKLWTLPHLTTIRTLH